MNNKTLWAIVLLIFLSLQLGIYARNQPQIAENNGRGGDGFFYGRLAEQFRQGSAPRTDAPFVYRVGVPWLAGRIALVAGISIDQAFQAINFLSLVALIFLIYFLGLRYCSPQYAALAAILYLLPFYSYARLLFFFPVLVDAPWLALMLAGLVIMTGWRVTTSSFLTLCLITFLATLIRETSLILPLSFLLSRTSVRRIFSLELLLGQPVTRTFREPEADNLRDLLFGLALLGAYGLGAFFTHRVSMATGEYSFRSAMLDSITYNALWYLVVSFCLAYGGPLLSTLIIEKRTVTRYFQEYPEFLAFTILTLILSYLGGINTVRFMAWASPIILILICCCLESMLSRIRVMAPSSKIILSMMIWLCLSYYFYMLHPFEGYFPDFTAWIEWGGLQFASMRSLPPVLWGVALMLAMVLLWRWIGPQLGDCPKGMLR